MAYDGAYVSPNGVHYKNFMLICPIHDRCEKTKGLTGPVADQLGPFGPLAFLHAWIPCEVKPGKSHPRSNPTIEASRAFLAANADDLRELYFRLVGEE